MHLINESYYKKLVDKFGKTKNVIEIEDTNFITINTAFLEKALIEKKVNLLIKIPTGYKNTDFLFANLILRLTELQFLEAVEMPEFKTGDLLKTLKSKRKKEYKIVDANGDTYSIQEISKGRGNSSFIEYSPSIVNYNWLKNHCKRITKGTQIKKLLDLEKLFNKLFGMSFVPDEFRSKSIVVCKKSIWNNLAHIEVLNCKLKDIIPLTYITKKGTEQPTINIDSALYFVPDYSTAYHCVLCKGETIDNIMLLDCNPDQFPTMIMDQREYNFGICAITTQNYEDVQGFHTWQWLKEEIDMINSL